LKRAKVFERAMFPANGVQRGKIKTPKQISRRREIQYLKDWAIRSSDVKRATSEKDDIIQERKAKTLAAKKLMNSGYDYGSNLENQASGWRPSRNKARRWREGTQTQNAELFQRGCEKRGDATIV